MLTKMFASAKEREILNKQGTCNKRVQAKRKQRIRKSNVSVQMNIKQTKPKIADTSQKF